MSYSESARCGKKKRGQSFKDSNLEHLMTLVVMP